jgi:hypothetical protein
MNIIIIIITIFLRDQNAKRELRTKIEKYLHRVKIVENSKTFALLRNTIALLDQARTTTTNSLIVNDSTLHDILRNMQTTIEQLQRNDSRFKSKSYTKILRIALESTIKSAVADRSINLKTTKQVREFTILIVDDVERKTLKIMIIKNIMNKLKMKRIRRIARLNNDDLRIQTKSEKIKNFLQKKSEIIRRIIESITIRTRIYAMRVNEIKVEHIDTNNQFDVIKYLQNVNASLHSSLIIKKMSWSFRVIRDKKRYFTLHMKIIIVKMINRMLFENFMKIFEIKKCERFIKNCILRQCFNCQKYEHIEKHCRIVVVCKKCVMKHHISECDSSITEKYKMCETCEDREHIAWSSKCRMRRKKKQKTKHVRQTRMRLYFVSESQIVFNVFRFVINSSTTSFTISITNSKVVLSKWKVIRVKKKKKNERLKSNISFESSSISRRIESKNSMTSSRDRSSWANNAIMNSKNMKKTLHRNSMNRLKFASKSFVNVNASIVINQMIDFDLLWKTQTFWSSCSIMFAMREYAQWSRCSLIKIFKIMMSLQYKSFDEIFSHRFHWAVIRMIFIYYTNRKMTSESAFTSTIK